MLVQLPEGWTLKQFKQEIQNLYYGRDNSALHKLLDSLTEKVDHEADNANRKS